MTRWGLLVAGVIATCSACTFNTNGLDGPAADAGMDTIDAHQPPTADASPITVDADPAYDASLSSRLLFEPNDSFSAATTIVPGTYSPIAIYPLGDHDFYKFTLDAAHDVDIKILFLETDGDLELKLYNGSHALVQPTSQGFMSNEEIIHTAAMNGQIGPGDYYIEVYGYNNAYTNDSYSLVLTVM